MNSSSPLSMKKNRSRRNSRISPKSRPNGRCSNIPLKLFERPPNPPPNPPSRLLKSAASPRRKGFIFYPFDWCGRASAGCCATASSYAGLRDGGGFAAGRPALCAVTLGWSSTRINLPVLPIYLLYTFLTSGELGEGDLCQLGDFPNLGSLIDLCAAVLLEVWLDRV